MRARTKLQFDTFEDRLTPAGNVTGVVSGGTLVLVGDEANNRIKIDPTGPGSVRVYGAEEGTWGETTINGDEDTFTGVTAIRTTMNAGDDLVWLDGVTLAKTLRITTQTGNDNILVVGCTIGGAVACNSGPERDVAQVIDSVLSQGFNFVGETGNDTLAIIRSMIAKKTLINTGDDDDRVFLGSEELAVDGSTFGGPVAVRLGRGSDRLDSFRSFYAGAVQVAGGDVANAFNIAESDFARTLRVAGGGGTDTLAMRDCSCYGRVSMAFAGGSDTASVADTLFLSTVRFDGGSGADTLTWLLAGNVFVGARVAVGFEAES